eukprot:m.75194 g.75194  ORF g.75194 m.75194 type:complete len:201 (-) comp12438_c0_seq3:271-873(-)
MHVNDAYSIAQAQHIDSPHQLTPQIGVSLDEPLVDPQGYPRSDIDVYQARHIRSEIRTLKTDHAQIMKEAEEMLVAIHQRAKEHGGELHPSDRPKMIAKKPILRVLDVLPGSPAFEAGMQRGDIIGAFGSLQSSNMRGMADVAALVTSSIGVCTCYPQFFLDPISDGLFSYMCCNSQLQHTAVFIHLCCFAWRLPVPENH